MDIELKSQLHLWENIDDLEIIPGDQIEPTLSRTTREVPCLLKPGTRESLIELVAVARSHKIPIYPVSRGKNWGYGAHLPVQDGCVIVSLERLKTIGPCHPESKKIYIEAGVSQMHLYEYLQKHYPQFTFNVTAGGSDTSIIGNCLERGIGYYRSRTHELHGLEVLTMDGQVLKRDKRLWHSSHPDGIGTDWEGLFFQSNFGIVLGGWFSLLPRQERTIFLSLLNSDLDTLIDDFKKLYRNRLLKEITHIADPGRKEYVLNGLISTKFPKLSSAQIDRVIQQVSSAAFQGITAIHGRAAVGKTMVKEIRKLISPSTTLNAFTPQKVKRLALWSRWIPIPRIRSLGIFLESVGELLLLSEGTPTNIGHLGIKMHGENPNDADELAVFLNATLPPRANATQTLRSLLDQQAVKYSITFIVNEEEAVSAIITLHFETGEAEQLQNHLKALTTALIENGFPPYRAGIDQMEQLNMPPISQQLKDFFDPLHLIAPGRYT
ncbi:MAG: FAD-dependent oxidoreductase [Verrucomicrobia bacterium]|nr:FAD-dependent oxidoreductase [Verrucomicrobiota bacterium]